MIQYTTAKRSKVAGTLKSNLTRAESYSHIDITYLQYRGLYHANIWYNTFKAEIIMHCIFADTLQIVTSCLDFSHEHIYSNDYEKV